jgi:hypothetical protein
MSVLDTKGRCEPTHLASDLPVWNAFTFMYELADHEFMLGHTGHVLCTGTYYAECRATPWSDGSWDVSVVAWYLTKDKRGRLFVTPSQCDPLEFAIWARLDVWALHNRGTLETHAAEVAEGVR